MLRGDDVVAVFQNLTRSARRASGVLGSRAWQNETNACLQQPWRAAYLYVDFPFVDLTACDTILRK